MRNVHVLCAGATVLAALMLSSCGKQETPAPKPETKVRPTDDPPIIISDSGSTIPLGGQRPIQFKTTNPKPFHEWENNGNSAGADVTEIFAPYKTLTSIDVTAGGSTQSFCKNQPDQPCHIDIALASDSPGTSSISVHYDPKGNHVLTLHTTGEHFNRFTNWNSASNGADIIDPLSNSSIAQIKVTGASGPPIDCTTVVCSVGLWVQ